MVAEAQALISARLPERLVAVAEAPTRNLISANAGELRDGRIDLVLAQRVAGRRPDSGELRRSARDLIEIKRGQAAWSEIEKDLDRLAMLCSDLPGPCRAFLVVGCEAGHVPRRLIDNGVASRTLGHIASGTFRTRRVWAASPTRKRTSSVHLVALVEVWPVAQ